MSRQSGSAPRLQGSKAPLANFGCSPFFFCVEDETLPLYSLLTVSWNVMGLCLLPGYTLFSLPEPFRHCQCWKEDRWLVSVITR